MQIKKLDWRPVDGDELAVYASTPMNDRGFYIFHCDAKYYSSIMNDHNQQPVKELVSGFNDIEKLKDKLQQLHDNFLMQFLEI